MLRCASLTLLLALALVAPATAGQWERTYPITGRPELVLRTDDASVHVTTWDRRAVGLRVTTQGWDIGGARGLSVQAAQTGNRVELEVREPRFRWNLQFGHRHRWTRIEVSVPRDGDLDVTTGDGAIEADGLRGDLHLLTSDGHIEATGLDGALEARSGDGGLRLEGRFDRLEVSTSDGRVVATALEGSRLASAWSLRSGDGSVSLRVPSTLRADLDLHTGDGDLWVGLPVETSGRFVRHTLRGRMNGGGPLLEMRSGDGSIRVEGL